MNVVETSSLGKRYRKKWALADCSLAIPEGRVTALIGTNGAGKTTLLHLLAGLSTPTTGQAAIMGGHRPGQVTVRDKVALVAQEAPVYGGMSVRDTLRAARGLNGCWDQPYAERRLAALDIPMRARAGKLSGGQRAQLALTLALARHPALLLLDEPLAALDPLARREVLGSLMGTVLDEGISVVFSSHVLGDLANVANYLVLLRRGRLRLAGELDGVLNDHRMLTGPASGVEGIARQVRVVQVTRAGRHAHVLARSGTAPTGWQAREVTMEELVLAYLGASDAEHIPGGSPARTSQEAEAR
jgi:ABC-2 type transport system ATP-binding protein